LPSAFRPVVYLEFVPQAMKLLRKPIHILV